jgi:hypothetical protein
VLSDGTYLALVVTEDKLVHAQTPNNYHEATQSPEADQWLKAMAEEIKALTHNCIFKLKPLPPSWKAIRACWLFKLKQLANSMINQFKACWVGKGYLQWPGVNFDKTFSPVVQMENLHLLLTIMTTLNL